MTKNAPLRIAVWHNLPSGGGRRALHQHINGLVGKGHHVEIWRPDTICDDGFMSLRGLAEEHGVPIPGHEHQSRIRETYDLCRGVRADIAAMNRHCQACGKEIEAKGFDLLFANASRDHAVTSIGRVTHLPKVLYLGEPLRELYEASPELPWRAPDPETASALFLAQVMARFLRHSLRIRKLGILMREEQDNARALDRILVNSVYSRESVLRAYGLLAEVCYLGIDTGLFVDQGLDREMSVISVGAIVPAKAIERSIEAVAALTAPRPRLELVGNAVDTDYRRHLEKLAAQRGVEVSFRVEVSDADLVKCLNRATAMIYTPRLEPFGFAPLEAAACGLPVVGVAEGGVRETVRNGETGFLVDANPQAMAKTLEKIFENPHLGRELGAKARDYVQEEWTADRAVDRLQAKLYEVVAKTRRGFET